MVRGDYLERVRHGLKALEDFGLGTGWSAELLRGAKETRGAALVKPLQRRSVQSDCAVEKWLQKTLLAILEALKV